MDRRKIGNHLEDVKKLILPAILRQSPSIIQIVNSDVSKLNIVACLLRHYQLLMDVKKENLPSNHFVNRYIENLKT